MRNRARLGAVACAGLFLLTGTAGAARTAPARTPQALRVPRQPAECCAATGANVPKVGGDYGDQDFSALTQVTAANVHALAGAWLDHLPGGSAADSQESTPVAVGGDLYLKTFEGDVDAVNGATGRVL